MSAAHPEGSGQDPGDLGSSDAVSPGSSSRRSDELAVRTRGLTKYFGDFAAVDDLDLEVERGRIFGFLGSNGAGKTTAIRMLCGLLTPSSGSAEVLGVDVARHPEEVKRRIGYMSQRFSLYEDLTVAQNLRFYGGVYGLRGSRLRQQEEWAVSIADLEGKEDVLTGSLSVGWKQRLALGCAVLHEPRLVFLDEPTSGVDPLSRRRFWRRIDEMSAQGTTVFVTTHYLDEAEHCHRLGLMHDGELIASGSVSDLKRVFGERTVLEVSCPRILEALEVLDRQDWVLETSIFGTRLHLVVRDPTEAEERTRRLLEERGIGPVEAEPILPSLEDVFIHHIQALEGGGPVADAAHADAAAPSTADGRGEEIP